jgi:hypothetical protein
MTFQRAHQIVLEWRAASGGSERAVAGGPAGAAGDLRQLRGIELAELVAVKLAIRREGNVLDIEVEPHADRVGCDR